MASLETLFILTIVILALVVALTNSVKQNQRKLAQLEATLEQLLHATLGSSTSPIEISAAVRAALAQGQVNQAIQHYRAEHDLSLHAAELAIHAIIRQRTSDADNTAESAPQA